MTARGVRISILLLILALVALDAGLTRWRTTSWDKPLRATIYPIVADNRQVTRDYVAGLTREDFTDLEAFLQQEAPRYGVAIAEPLRVRLGPVLAQLPPMLPREPGIWAAVTWSLKLRWWANRRESDQPRPHSQIRMFVLYFDPAESTVLAHSLGLEKGLIGVVNAFASRAMGPTNNVVIAHELLHTLGATDKYDPSNALPRFPDGYAEPDRVPRYPQRRAELMAGRIPIAPDHAEIPVGLANVMIGPGTAREIGWVRK
jgi:hypothetical protein